MALSIQAVRGEEFPRSFTANVTDFGDWAQIEPLLEQLDKQIAEAQTPAELEQWLLRDSELNAALDEEYTRRYIAMTCATDDTALEQAYIDFLEKIIPQLKPWHDRLGRAYLASPARARLEGAPRQRLDVMDRGLENAVKMFREENVPLQTEDSKLAQQYQKISGAMTVKWRGEEKTLQQMSPCLEDTDRAVREEAWRLIAGRRLQDAKALNTLFDQLIELRTRIARNAGFENYRDYRHQALDRFDYTPADCIRFHEAIEAAAVPLEGRLRAWRKERLGVTELRPWDLSVDPEGNAPLQPFTDVEELKTGCAKIFESLSPSLGKVFSEMRQRGLLDLDSRKGKAPGGYQSTLDEVRLPFIFMNAAGTNRDVFTLLHEGGHAFHAFAARQEPLLAYRSAPIEFCEVASMSMELFGMNRLGVFYPNEADARRARRRQLEDLLTIFPWIATIDAFQHWIYTHPGHTALEREEEWLRLEERFNPGVDWSGLENERRSIWHRQLHLFEVPFYYIEYGIAQLGALQMWLIFRDRPEEALAGYQRALALGGARPLPELFAAAGIRFDFSVETLKPIMDAVAAELEL